MDDNLMFYKYGFQIEKALKYKYQVVCEIDKQDTWKDISLEVFYFCLLLEKL